MEYKDFWFEKPVVFQVQILKWQYSLFLEIEFLLGWQPLLERKNCLPAILFTWQHTCWNNWDFFNDNRLGYQRYNIKIKSKLTLFFYYCSNFFQSLSVKLITIIFLQKITNHTITLLHFFHFFYTFIGCRRELNLGT